MLASIAFNTSNMAQGVSETMARVLHPLVPTTSTGFGYGQCKPFFEAVRAGRWETARDFHIQHPEAVTVRNPLTGKTALHIAVEAGHVDIVKELVSLMEADDLEIKSTRDGRTALAIAAIKGITEMAECMVTKNKKLLSIPDAINDIPIVEAYLFGRWHTARYLYSVTPLEDLMPDKGPYGATIISNCFISKEFDIAWDLIQRGPKLAITLDRQKLTPLENLASNPSSFLSGAELNFWQQWVYNCLYIQPPRINLICVTVQNEENPQANNGRSLIRSVGGLVERLVSHSEKQKEGFVSKIVEILGIKRIYEMKIFHVRSLAFLKLMCEEIKDLDEQQMNSAHGYSAIFQAINKGNVEFITHTCKANPELLWSKNYMLRGIFDIAIQCRQEKIYNLIYGISEKDWVANLADIGNNNKLHMTGLLSSSAQAQLNRIPGAALQMQRELQWYKEVETILPPKLLDGMNSDYLTPRELFTKNHSGLLKEGEKWMKETATSYTVVGALIITIMFAAVITVPGGNKDTGFPTFINEKLFMLFIVSDAILLFSSTTATLMFLGILTSRFAEDDFLKSLPTKMIIGLASLFFAIATMMIAFSAVRGQSWIVIPTILLSSVPVTLFAWMQFPLLVRIAVSTYGKGIFNRNVERWS